MNKKVLVLGITGGVGSAALAEFSKQGWQIAALHRNPQKAMQMFPDDADIRWFKGDALNSEDVLKASRGADIILHGVNPPGYKNWDTDAMPMLQNSVNAAVQGDARLIFPGNVYTFSKQAPELVDEQTPHDPDTVKGRIRLEMEDYLRACAADGAKILIVRAADFFGPHSPGSWFSNMMVKAGKPLKSVTYPGQSETGHSWAYLPDLAATIAALAACEDRLANFECFHFKGHQFDRGIEIAELICKVGDLPMGRISNFPWIVITLTAPFVRLFREIREMRYLWQRPLMLDNSKLVSFLGHEPHTPIEQALRHTLKSMRTI